MARRNSHNSDSRYYFDWLERAEEDLRSAHKLLEDEDCYNSAAFHCQQTVEKSLKAYVLLRTGRLLEGHNLSWLCKQAMRYHDNFSQWLDECAALNRCYIETRYPADIPLELGYPQVVNYCEMAREMFYFTTQVVSQSTVSGKSHPSQLRK